MGPNRACTPHRLPRPRERQGADGHAGQEAQGDNCAVGWDTLTYSHTRGKNATRRSQLEDRAPPVEEETLPNERGVPDAATPRPCVHPLQQGTHIQTQTTTTAADSTSTTTTLPNPDAQIQLLELQEGEPRVRSLKQKNSLLRGWALVLIPELPGLVVHAVRRVTHVDLLAVVKDGLLRNHLVCFLPLG